MVLFTLLLLSDNISHCVNGHQRSLWSSILYARIFTRSKAIRFIKTLPYSIKLRQNSLKKAAFQAIPNSSDTILLESRVVLRIRTHAFKITALVITAALFGPIKVQIPLQKYQGRYIVIQDRFNRPLPVELTGFR